jgi:hypothetical protein
MTLSNLIRKGGLAQVATATSATMATQEARSAATVAQVATVAVAKPANVAAMTAGEETAIRAWLAHIEETDPDIIAHVLSQCRADLEARAYFVRRADEMPRPLPDDDDRRHCAQCTNLTPSGLCLAARRGVINASRTYHPVDHLPRRCEGYTPGPDDPDRQPGHERWPGLTVKTEETKVQSSQMISAKSEGRNGRNG